MLLLGAGLCFGFGTPSAATAAPSAPTLSRAAVGRAGAALAQSAALARAPEPDAPVSAGFDPDAEADDGEVWSEEDAAAGEGGSGEVTVVEAAPAAELAAAPKPERTWVQHRIVPGESGLDIAERYGVTVAELKRWNKGYGKNGQLYAGRSLKVHARLVPPPREKILVKVNKGDTWSKIADAHGVKVKDLQAWNKAVPRAFKAGTALVVYTNPTVDDAASAPVPGALPRFNVPRGGYAIGAPNSGRLAGGVKLPDSDMYKLRRPDNAYGTSHAVKVVLESIARYTRDAKPDAPLEIGDMSRQGGGRLRPHSSHRTGRDIDIRLPKVGDEIDWRAAWILVRSFIASGEVNYIFLDYDQQRKLHRAAQAAGATDQELDAAIQYPRGSRTNRGIVRHAKGHTVHIHIRVKCAEANDRCVTY